MPVNSFGYFSQIPREISTTLAYHAHAFSLIPSRFVVQNAGCAQLLLMGSLIRSPETTPQKMQKLSTFVNFCQVFSVIFLVFQRKSAWRNKTNPFPFRRERIYAKCNPIFTASLSIVSNEIKRLLDHYDIPGT